MKSTVLVTLCLTLLLANSCALAAPIKALSHQQPALQSDSDPKSNLSVVLFYVYMQLEQEALRRLIPPNESLTRQSRNPETEPRFPALMPIPDAGF